MGEHSDSGMLARLGDVDTLRDRFRGALLGLAVGEALGAPAEFMSPSQIVERYGLLTEMVGGGCYDVAPGEPTDATDMMLCLAESLADGGDFDPGDIIERYRRWFEDSPRDVSLTVRTVMLSYRAGTPWDLASRRAFEILGSPRIGNGSLMRTAPIALRYIDDPEQRRDVSQRESMLTHFDNLAGWTCAAYNDLIAAAMAGELREQLTAIAAVYEDEDRRVSEAVRDAEDTEPSEVMNSTFVLESLRTAVWSVLRSPDFEEAVCLTVNLGNDADTVGAITGALAGAVYGEAAIPPRWLAPLFRRERIIAAADGLLDLALR